MTLNSVSSFSEELHPPIPAGSPPSRTSPIPGGQGCAPAPSRRIASHPAARDRGRRGNIPRPRGAGRTRTSPASRPDGYQAIKPRRRPAARSRPPPTGGTRYRPSWAGRTRPSHRGGAALVVALDGIPAQVPGDEDVGIVVELKIDAALQLDDPAELDRVVGHGLSVRFGLRHARVGAPGLQHGHVFSSFMPNDTRHDRLRKAQPFSGGRHRGPSAQVGQ